jgi:type VI secretion system protein ImpK
MSTSKPLSRNKEAERTVSRPSPGGRRPRTAKLTTSFSDLAAMTSYTLKVTGDNPLLTSSFSLLSLIPELRDQAFHEAANALQERMITSIKKFEKSALQKGASRTQVNIAKYFLCSLLDETVLNTPWGSQSGWGHNSLSSLFFKKLVGGEEFFQILGRLKEQPDQNQNLLEMAYLCLSLGFEGKYRYRNNGLIAIERQREEIFLLIRQFRGDVPSELSTRWRGAAALRNPLIRFIPLWVLVTVTGVLLLFIYMIFAYTIRDQSDQLYNQLFTVAKRIEKKSQMQLVQPIVAQKPVVSLKALFGNLLADEIARKKVAIIDGKILRIFDMFLSGSAEIRPEYQPLMSKIAKVLNPENVRILVKGHTDNQKIKFSSWYDSNWQLSSARAESAAMAFSQNGLPKTRINSEGLADKEPIAPNDTEANRALNRRIDIYFR